MLPLPDPILTERLRVRLPAEGDAPAIVRYYTDNREFLAPWEPARPEGFFTEAFWREQVLRAQKDAAEGRALRLYLFPREASDTVVGTIGFTEIVRGVFHACYLGYSLAEHAQGRGYMREALGAAVARVFAELNLHRVMANYMPHNVRSGRLLRALGFEVEGYARDYVRINGRWEDHVLTALTNPEWREHP